MLPCATHDRVNREASMGKQSGRTQEIQRLIGRSLRAITNLQGFGERQIKIDCDVIRADGGTRTASITGAYVALYLAFKKLVATGGCQEIPLRDQIAAISCGIYQGHPVLDLDYAEDCTADADANFVLTASGKIIEVQMTAEQAPISQEHYQTMMELARQAMAPLIKHQLKALGMAL